MFWKEAPVWHPAPGLGREGAVNPYTVTVPQRCAGSDWRSVSDVLGMPLERSGAHLCSGSGLSEG